ncbi:PA14 domain-containing protein [Pontibacter akesuensis]|uniref:PA14 domain-containing protein n=1 Tax=Pontibacter akesuensis TaxID=388950 RepID=UPI00167BF032|nr:PA14 domain-containing protein [Pontibacter akesuensis]
MITKGGTYTGNWESRDSNVSAVEIQTTEPVTIINSNIRAAGRMIRSAGHGAANITVRNTSGYGITPTPYSDYKKPRNFMAVDEFKNIVVENCYIEGAAGIALGGRYLGDGSQNQTVKIRYNKAKNIDGRIYGGSTMVNFVSLNFRGAIRNAEVAWNQVINEPSRSAVEDNINVSNTRGTSDSPIRIHNNYIQGAYPINPTSSTYSGGGIIMDSWWNAGMPEPSTIATAYVKVYDNQTVNLGNYNYAIAGGNNIEITGNRAVNSARLPDGTIMNTHNIGFYGYDYYKKGVTHTNTVHRNITGLMGTYAHQRNDVPYFPDGTVKHYDNATLPAGTITKVHEQQEYELWLQKLQRNSVTLGPGGSAPVASSEPAPAPTTAPAPTSPTTTTTGTTTAETGKITREFWADTEGNGSISAIPLTAKPTSITTLSSFEAPSNAGSTYGQRVRGYITAPETGLYTFWIAGDDNAELYLSTSESESGKRKIASVTGWTNSREWNKYDSQQSAQVKLEAGKRYYIEALHIQNWGGDNLAVAWQLPSGAKEAPVAGKRLSTLGSTASAPVASISLTGTATGKITRDFWANQHGGTTSHIQLGQKPTSTTELTSFEAPSDAANNYSQRISGYITAPETGLYTFYIAGDDHADLYLSTTEDAANKRKIASVNGHTNPREWTKYSSQKSVEIRLEAGKRYYIEALHKEDGGGDNLAVAWKLPNGAMEAPIAGNRLSTIGSLQGISAMQISKAADETDAFFAKATAYPNPFRDMVTLTLGTAEAELAQVVIVDQTGREVYKEATPKLVNNELSMNLADLKSGLYILKYTDKAGKTNSLKIVKE